MKFGMSSLAVSPACLLAGGLLLAASVGYVDPYTKGGMATRSMSQATPESRNYFDPAQRGLRSVRWHNVVCKDNSTKEEWSILSERGIIGTWYRANPVNAFIAVMDDTNNDKVLNDRDARVVIVTDITGRNPRVVTPRDAQVWSIDYNSAENKLNFTIVKDTNRDKRFDEFDISSPWSMSFGSNGVAEPLISDAMREKLQQLAE